MYIIYTGYYIDIHTVVVYGSHKVKLCTLYWGHQLDGRYKH